MHGRYSLFFIVVFWSAAICLGQKKERKNEFLVVIADAQADSLLVFSSDQAISAIAIKAPENGVFNWVSTAGNVRIPQDEDVDQPTYFLSFPSPLTEVTLSVPSDLNFDVFLISSGNAPKIETSRMRQTEANECGEPIMYVDQVTWREGLPAPSYSRSFHDVYHNVVHHSAGSNTSTNYTQVVRDIYLYHTQVNGWSDIGYNYLIAQDGTIFAGRDPDGGDQDRVRGAHFCGANTGTLGVCLLGNYETASPSDPTWTSLKSLLTFELLNQDLDPFDAYSHPLGNLGTIIGHRDGCATLCPGENVYSLLGELRIALANQLDGCTQNITTLAVLADTTLIAVNQELTLSADGNYSEYFWLTPGTHPFELSGNAITVDYPIPGFYDITLIGIEGQVRDTLHLTDYLQVSLLENEPVVFPNPIRSNKSLTIDFKEGIIRSSLYDMQGKLISQWGSPSTELNNLQPGIYFLEINTKEKTFREKLIVL